MKITLHTYWDLPSTVPFELTARLQTVLNRTVWKWGTESAKRAEGLLISTGLIFILCALLVNAVNDAVGIPPIFLAFVFLLLIYILTSLTQIFFKRAEITPKDQIPEIHSVMLNVRKRMRNTTRTLKTNRHIPVQKRS